MDEEDWYHNGVLFSQDKERNPTICNNMDKIEGIVLSEISHTEKGRYYMISLIYEY